MARAATGQIYTRKVEDDVVFMVRFRGKDFPKQPLELGRVSQGFDMTQAGRRRDLIVAQILDGRWRAPDPPNQPPPPATATATTFRAACVRYVKRKQKTKKKESTLAGLRTTISVHLLPSVGPELPVGDITPEVVSRHVDRIDAQNARIREAELNGTPERRPMTQRELRRSGGESRVTQKLVPISDGQLNKQLELLHAILEPFVGTELDENPVGICDHRRDHTSAKTWNIEADEVVSLLKAAESLDRPVDDPETRRLRGACVRLRREGLTYAQIASKLDKREGWVGYHVRKHAAPAVPAVPIIPMYRALIYLLIIAGLRISEALALRCGDIDLHHGNIYVLQSKTKAGIRVVHIHEPLRTVLRAYKIARGATWEDGAYAFWTSNQTALSRHNIARRTMPRLIAEANNLRRQQDHPPIRAHVTAHAMRHAYIALLAHGGAPRIYTQRQGGHSRPTTADWAYNYVMENEAREQVGQGIQGVLERGEGDLDGSRKRSYPAVRVVQPPERRADSRQLGAAVAAVWLDHKPLSDRPCA